LTHKNNTVTGFSGSKTVNRILILICLLKLWNFNIHCE